MAPIVMAFVGMGMLVLGLKLREGRIGKRVTQWLVIVSGIWALIVSWMFVPWRQPTWVLVGTLIAILSGAVSGAIAGNTRMRGQRTGS